MKTINFYKELLHKDFYKIEEFVKYLEQNNEQDTFNVLSIVQSVSDTIDIERYILNIIDELYTKEVIGC